MIRYNKKARSSIIKTIEAVISKEGEIRLMEPFEGKSEQRAIVVVLDDAGSPDETAALTEEALQDWNRPEEDSAWSHLQPAK